MVSVLWAHIPHILALSASQKSVIDKKQHSLIRPHSSYVTCGIHYESISIVSFRLRKSIMLKKINKMKLDSTVASFTQQRNQVVLVMKPKRSVREFSWKACVTCQK